MANPTYEDLRAALAKAEAANSRLWEAVESAREAFEGAGMALAQLGANGHLPTGEDGRRWWDDVVCWLDDGGKVLDELGDKPASDNSADRTPAVVCNDKNCGLHALHAKLPEPTE